VGLIVGEKECWGKGFATEAIRLVMQLAFAQLGLRRLTAGAYASNIASIRAFEKAGFSREGLRRRHYLCDGEYVDGVLMGVLRDEIVAE
jgi:RimJ/RimL family protein N-acetyltransferase